MPDLIPNIAPILARWIHILCAVTILGGMIFALLAALPAANALASPGRETALASIFRRFRPWLYLAIAGVLLSGTWNLLNKKNATPLYHAIIGVKMLFALHIFAVGFLICQTNNAKRSRQLVGAVIGGLVILAISAYLRSLNVT